MVGIMKNGYDDACDQHAVCHQQSYFVIALGSGMRYAARVNGVRSGGGGWGGAEGGGLVHLTVLFASNKQQTLMTLFHRKPLITSVLCYCMNERCACRIYPL